MKDASATVDASQPDRVTLTAFTLLVLLGGLNFPAVKATVQELAPMWSAGVRFTAAALLLLGVVLVRRLPFPRGRALAGTLLFGSLSFGAFYAFAYWGIERLPAGLSSVVLASAPLLTFLAAVLQRLEPFRWLTLLGALLALVGIGVMVGGPGGTGSLSLLAVLALLGAGACAAQAAVVAKRFPPVPPLMMNALGMAVGGALLLGLSFGSNEPHVAPTEAGTWLGLGYLVLLGSIALFGAYLFVLGRWTASGASYAFVLFPVVSVAFGALFREERITAGLVVGGILVLVGVYIGALLHVGKARTADSPPEEAVAEPRPELAGVPADCVRCP